MQWLNSFPFADNRVLQIGFLAACGIAALIVLAILYRLTFARRLRVPGGRTRQPRLGLVDAFSLDGQRQLVLIRRDNVEHLVMIGGPNDVLVESQINRGAAAARENSQTSPLLVPATPARRAEPAAVAAPALAEAPPKAVAKTPASAAAPAAAPPPAPAPASPPPAQAAKPLAPAKASAPTPKPAPVETAPASPKAAQAAGPARPAPASSPPPRPERPTPPRPSMPPPIIPAGAPANRALAARPTEPAPAKGAGNSPVPSPVGLAPAPRLEKSEPAVTAAKAEQAAAPAKTEPAAAAKTEPRATPTGTNVPPANLVSAAQPALRVPHSAPAPDEAPKFVAPVRAPADNGTQKSAEVRPPADKANAPPNDKPAPKVDDPFADIDSLEAEMARLLGREKPD